MKTTFFRQLSLTIMLMVATAFSSKAQSTFQCPASFNNELDCAVSFILTIDEKVPPCTACPLSAVTIIIPPGSAINFDCLVDGGCTKPICAATITWVSPGTMTPATISWSGSGSGTFGALSLPANSGCNEGPNPRLIWAPSGNAAVSR